MEAFSWQHKTDKRCSCNIMKRTGKAWQRTVKLLCVSGGVCSVPLGGSCCCCRVASESWMWCDHITRTITLLESLLKLTHSQIQILQLHEYYIKKRRTKEWHCANEAFIIVVNDWLLQKDICSLDHQSLTIQLSIKSFILNCHRVYCTIVAAYNINYQP